MNTENALVIQAGLFPPFAVIPPGSMAGLLPALAAGLAPSIALTAASTVAMTGLIAVCIVLSIARFKRMEF